MPASDWRERYTAFIVRHEIAWELTMGLLAIIFVVIGFVADDAPPAVRPALDYLDLALTLVFVAEFGSRFIATPNRAAYLRGHWIDLLALLPAVRGLRIARLFRLLRLVRTFAGVFRALSRIETLAAHRGLVWLFVAWLGTSVICSLGLYALENGVNKAVASPTDALWWGIVTLTTVGYGDVYPITPEGRLVAALLMILGIVLFSGITATITSFLVGEGSSDDPLARLRELGRLRDDGVIDEAEFGAKKAQLLARV
jgi:voltage-gated potassium channel